METLQRQAANLWEEFSNELGSAEMTIWNDSYGNYEEDYDVDDHMTSETEDLQGNINERDTNFEGAEEDKDKLRRSDFGPLPHNENDIGLSHHVGGETKGMDYVEKKPLVNERKYNAEEARQTIKAARKSILDFHHARYSSRHLRGTV
jgi:hypothetical protein